MKRLILAVLVVLSMSIYFSTQVYAGTTMLYIQPPIGDKPYELNYKSVLGFKYMIVFFNDGYKTPRFEISKSFYDPKLLIYFIPSVYPTVPHKIYVKSGSVIDKTKPISVLVGF